MTTTMTDLASGRTFVFNEALPGRDAYELALAEGFQGDRTAWLAAQKGFAYDLDHQDWGEDREYPPFQAVRWDNRLWLARAPSLGVEPGTDADSWSVLIDRGPSDEEILEALDAQAEALDGKAAAEHQHPAADIDDSTETGRALLTAADTAAGRGALGLGSAATSDVTTGPTDSTAGRLLKVADSPSLLAAVAALSVLGRSANSNGALGDIVAGANGHVLRRDGDALAFGPLTADAFGDNTIAPGRLTNFAALTVLGRGANSTGAAATIAAGSDHQVLRRSGTTLGFGAVNLAQAAAVTGLLPAANVAVHPALRVTCGGTANAVTLTTGAGISGTPPTGLQLRFRASAANTGATTIALDGGSAIACRTVTGVALPAGYIRTDADTIATFDGTFWVLNRAEERGSNANGTFTRTETGGLLCEHRITIDEYAGTNRMGKTWTYPAAFASAPRVHVSLPMVNQDSFIGLSGGSSGGRAQIRSWGPGEFSTNSTSSQVNVWAETGTFTDGVSSITGVHLTATGPWY